MRAKSLPRPDWEQPTGMHFPNFKLDRVSWFGVGIPSLLNEYWFRFKWLTSDGIVWRSWINNFDLIYDQFNRNLTMEFDYDTEFFFHNTADPHLSGWRLA